MGICQQKKYTELSYQPKNPRLDFQYNPNPSPKQDYFTEFNKKQQKKEQEQAKLFQKYLDDQQKKKKEEDRKFVESWNKFEQKRVLKPNQTQMAKVIYGYMRLYGRKPGDEARKFIDENYNSNYRSERYTLNETSPTYTYKYELFRRLETAHESNYISNWQQFKNADQKNRKIEYQWWIRHQLTNNRIVYECVATFDQNNRLLTQTFRQQDRFVHRPRPPSPKSQKPQPVYGSSSNNNYYPPPTDWNAHYNAEVQRSNQQFRANMNRQAEDWNNYARQRNARGW